ncbi:MAG: S-adenosyl-l-methionine hydroxide adenosyltransferase family protein [Anaerolineae bacterium]
MRGETSVRPTVTLMTDFGLTEPYVGVMKGVILNIVPEAALVDLTHAIPPQDIRQAAFLLSTAVDYFPTGTVHVVVVDPGVGSERRPIAVKSKREYYVAPDNGVLSMALARRPAETIVHLANSDYWLPNVSATFHGRDIFAPVAAHLARGVPIDDLGTPIHQIVRLPEAHPTRQPDGGIVGQVQHIDRFGDCITNVPSDMLRFDTPPIVRVAGQSIQGISPAYTAVEPGRPVSLIGSSGFLEIAVCNGNAAEQLDIKVGDTVLIEPQ